ncbi:helix-turn-helix domain-containing protein [Salinicoccus roseus]|uniref:helix-turn-helix domain-containing protein n=1 Tax=Salinicoccus roseus TaxID=45670 RepID=UPI001CA61232|nr:helix-turn-helix domain-containing protein [Salinicoccus roseus]MBY8910637.1 helix-turn-helix domain-containing protein [Salinicoccus roseus]MCG7331724.1 helix-turn-helix domain-containing protein [Salinicoccus roseus]
MTGRIFSPEEKLEIIQEWIQGASPRELCTKYQVHDTTLSRWRKKYDKYGADGLKKRKKHRSYTRTFKEMIAREHQNDTISLSELAYKYDIPSKETVRQWIMRYNNGEEIRTKREGASPLNKGRKTTYAERIEIAQYHAQRDISYRELAERFEVSYQQARNIVVKYREYGEAGLEDKRGKGKSEAQLTDMDRLNREISMLKADKRKLEVENALLKKLEELERD